MKNILSIAVLALFLSVGVANAAGGPAAIPAVGGGSSTSVLTPVGILAAPLVLVAAVATNQDPWHPLACALFGDNGRVGTDTDSACKH